MSTTGSGRLGSSPMFGPEMIADPYPFYHKLRSLAPMRWVDAIECWVLTRYEDVSAVLRDGRFSAERSSPVAGKSDRPEVEEMFRIRSNAMLVTDAPRHTRLRGLVSKAFTPRAVEAMRPKIQAMVDGVLDAVQPQGQMDVMRDLAFSLPVVVIAEMLGVPPEDRARFKQWADDITVVTTNVFSEQGEEALLRAATAYRELVDYFRGVVHRLRSEPEGNLLGALATAEEQGDRLNEAELYANAVLLLNAGHETTTNLIGNGTLALLRHPDQLRTLRDRPELIENAVEELLRYDSPVQFTARQAKQDVEIGGQSIRAGQFAMLVLGAANRDPARFPEPDRLDITRRDLQHVAFGMGPHYCLGAPLARLEGQVVFSTLLRRLPGLRLATETPEYRENFNLRGLKALPVAF